MCVCDIINIKGNIKILSLSDKVALFLPYLHSINHSSPLPSSSLIDFVRYSAYF